MARIRTIKPDFFRHEQLQDLEIAHPKQYIMLTFAGLWTLCDNQGVFPFKPRSIKLDILPFLSFDMTKTLDVLVNNGLIKVFKSGSDQYGYIPTFLTHQRLNTKELQEGKKYPEYTENQTDNIGDTQGTHLGRTRDESGTQLGSQEGKGKEWEKERKGTDEAVVKPPMSEPEINHFLIELIKKDFPRVQKMQSPLTNEQAEKIAAEFPSAAIKTVLAAMENKADLLKKYTNANLTIRDWIKRELNGNHNNRKPKPGPLADTVAEQMRTGEWANSKPIELIPGVPLSPRFQTK